MRLPIVSMTCTILGNHYKQTEAAWTGLDLARAELRRWPHDHHLGVPWCHPSDQTGSPDDFDCIYRVRPKMEPGKKWKGKMVKNVDFVLDNGAWWIDVEFDRPNPPHVRTTG